MKQELTDIINVTNGEISQTVADVQWDMKVTFKTILNIEHALDSSTAVLALRCANGQLKLHEIATIILQAVLTKSPDCERTLDAVCEQLFKNGYRLEAYRNMVYAILWYGLTGGKSEKKAEVTETKTETNPQTSPGPALSDTP